MEKLYEGKAKVLYREGPDTLRVYFKDEATAFNAQKRGVIPGKGAVNNKVSAALFRYLEAHGGDAGEAGGDPSPGGDPPL